MCNNSRDIEFFLGDYFFWRALQRAIYEATGVLNVETIYKPCRNVVEVKQNATN